MRCASVLVLTAYAAAYVTLPHACGAALQAPASSERVWVMTERDLKPDQLRVLRGLDRLVIMIPGVSSGDLVESSPFLDGVRKRGGYEQALFYNWEANNPARKMVAPAATEPAAARLIRLCEALGPGNVSVDILAHSAGTVVVNKAAEKIVATGSSARFRHVLLLGTVLAAREPLDELKKVSARVLNVHSAYDKVNRNVNNKLGRLPALTGEAHGNLRMDRSLGGRLMRHYVFLSSNPENEVQYGTYLRTGAWPTPGSWPMAAEFGSIDLHRLAVRVKAQPGDPNDEIGEQLPEWLAHPEPEVRYYAVVLAGLVRAQALAPTLKDMLAAPESPVYLRKDIYQALGNMEDGRHVDFIRQARDHDPACDEEIRDVARELKRKRIAPLR